MWNDEVLDMTIGFHMGDPQGLANAIRKSLARGDYSSWISRLRARWLLRKAEQEVAMRTGLTLEGAAVRQAIAAERSARWAGWAIIISVVALVFAALPYLKGG